MKRFRASDPTANTAVKRADKAAGIPKDESLRLAAKARRRGNLAGEQRFLAAARRGGGDAA